MYDIVEIDETVDYETVNTYLDGDWILLKIVEWQSGFLYIVGRPSWVKKEKS